MASGNRERSRDVLIVGGGLGGVAAALAAARLGRTVLLVEPTAWIGGQLTSQGVSAPDEHPWIESFGCTASYRALRNGIRAYYSRHYPLTPDPARLHLNPGNGLVSRLCHEPRVALAVLHELLAPQLASGRLQILTGWSPVAADVDGDRVRGVLVQGVDGSRLTCMAPYVIDASELGDVLPLVGAEHVVGAEARADTGEPHAPPTANPGDVQSFTWCAMLAWYPGEDHTIDRPAGYERFRAGGHLSWVQPHPVTRVPRRYTLFPNEPADAYPLWTYRRVLDRSLFAAGGMPSDLSVVNWPQNDHVGGNLLDPDPARATAAALEARQQTLSVVHWLQSEAPRPDGGIGYPGLALRGDALGSNDGLALAPYVRESRRIAAETRVSELDVAKDLRPEATAYPDSVGIGLYRIDLHPSAAGSGYLDIPCCPFQIPMGALIPVRLGNLLAGAKNIGTTHIANGAYRLHPVEWNIGEAAGVLAAEALETGVSPSGIRADPERRAAYQRRLERMGVPLAWPRAHPI